MKLGLVLTNDWELFGDGSGDFFEIQYDPTMNLLELFEKQNAKVTLMAECMQQWEHLKIAGEHSWAKDIANGWEEVLRSAIDHGSDVQLHLHPQWINSEYKNDKWKLDMRKWSLASLHTNEVSELIKKGKEYLKSLLKGTDQNYQCIAFRAGSYCIQPSDKVISALIENGFQCDTSVTQGLYAEGLYDFRKAYSNIFPWYINNDVQKKSDGKTSLIEYPIFSFEKLYSEALNKYAPAINNKIAFGINIPNDEISWAKKRDHLKSIRYPRENRYYKKKEKKDLKWYLKKLVSKTTIQLDYDYLPATLFVNILNNLYNSALLDEYRELDIIIPVIASGHIKDVPDLYNIEKILRLINEDHKDKIEFMTLTEAINNYYEIEKEMEVLP
jgi:hypothetical protein